MSQCSESVSENQKQCDSAQCQLIKDNVTMLRLSENRTQCYSAQSVRKSNIMSLCSVRVSENQTMWQCSVSNNQTQCHNAQSVRKSNIMSLCSVRVSENQTMWQCSVSNNQTQCHNAQSVRKSNIISLCSVRVSENQTMWQCSVSNNQTQCHSAQSVGKSNTISQCSACQKIWQCDSAQWQTIKDNVTVLSVGRTFSIQVQDNSDRLIAAHFLPTRHAGEIMEACFRWTYPLAATVAGTDRSDKRTRWKMQSYKQHTEIYTLTCWHACTWMHKRLT